MKQKRKHILKKSIFLGLILLQFSCNLEEEFITEKNHLGNNRIRYLYGEEALKKSKNLESKIITSHRIDILSRTNIALNTNEGIVDYTKVLEVVDENNNVNYTFKITNHPEDSETVFHNLVLSNENTSDEKVLLLKYESNTPTNSIVNFNGTVTRKSIASATNPCDTSTSDIDFTANTGSDNGSSTPIPGDNNIIVTPPYSSSGNGGNSGNSFSDDFVIYDCNSAGCGFITMDRAAMLAHYAPQGFTAAYYFGRQSSTTNTEPCDPNGNIGIINDSVVKTPCDELNKTVKNQAIQQTLNLLKGQSSGSIEMGFYIRQATNNVGVSYLSFPVIPQNINKPNELDIAAGLSTGNIKGAMHCHNDPATTNMIPMFSAADFAALHYIASNHIPPNNEIKDYSEYSVMLSVGFGQYAVKFKNFNGYANFNQNYTIFKEKLEEDYDKLGAIASSTLLTTAFLKNMNKYFGNSVGFYKANEIIDTNGESKITGWKEQTLDANGGIVEINCQ